MDYPINAEAARQLIEMVDRDVVRAELARRMGWQIIKVDYDETWKLVIENTEFVGLPDYESAVDKLPDPFTSAADNRALLEWLATDNERWFVFIRSLIKLLPKPERGEIRDATFRDLVHELSLFMTAPLETITLAAAQALGIPIDAPPGQT